MPHVLRYLLVFEIAPVLLVAGLGPRLPRALHYPVLSLPAGPGVPPERIRHLDSDCLLSERVCDGVHPAAVLDEQRGRVQAAAKAVDECQRKGGFAVDGPQGCQDPLNHVGDDSHRAVNIPRGLLDLESRQCILSQVKKLEKTDWPTMGRGTGRAWLVVRQCRIRG